MRGYQNILADKFSKNAAVIMFVDGENEDGTMCYAYVAVRFDLYQDFKAAYDDGDVVLDKYGIVLAEGTGLPSDELKARIAHEFGFQHAALQTA